MKPALQLEVLQERIKLLREAVDRADALASSQARTILSQQETIEGYMQIISLQHKEIGRLEQLARIVGEAP